MDRVISGQQSLPTNSIIMMFIRQEQLWGQLLSLQILFSSIRNFQDNVFRLAIIQMKKSKKGVKKEKEKPAQIPSTENDEVTRNAEVYQRFKRYLCKRRVDFLKERLADYYGKNFVIDYQERFNFEEEWEDKLGSNSRNNDVYGLEENPIEIGSSIFIVLVLAATVWVSSVELIFRNSLSSKELSVSRDSYRQIYILGACTIFLDWLLKVRKKVVNNTFEFALKPIFLDSFKQVLCIISFVIKIFASTTPTNPFWIVFEVIVIYILYSKASSLYVSIRLISYSLYYQYHSKICDLIITLFLILHFISIVLYLSTFFGYPTNWMTSLEIDHSNEFIVYIYSFYYASTTILTVGYGDISPKNPAEVVIIVMIQILGIATLGFIVSEIGYCISNLRKAREVMEKDLSIILKMKKHYNMNEKILNQARSFIVNNTLKVDQLYPNEEKALLQKFNEQLRNNISRQNLSSVIKSSIFFITRWSINFQRSVSNKLEHILFSPNDILYQPKHKERIYIVKSGKINVYAEKSGRKKGQKNLLKTISNSEEKEIADNCYGYTAVISTRPSRLYAIAKDVTSAYYIEKQKFNQCLSQRFSDYEYFHEIKSKMDQEEHWEAFEAPLIESSKSHYNPTKKQIIRKSNRLQLKLMNLRQIFVRGKPRQGLVLVLDQQKTTDIRRRVNRLDSKQQTSDTVLSFCTQMLDQIKEEDSSLSYESEQIEFGKYLKQGVLELTEEVLKEHFDHYFDVSKEYSNYFPRKNRSVLQKLELEYVLPNSNEEEAAQLNNQVYKASWR